jgi:hypothetical protein
MEHGSLSGALCHRSIETIATLIKKQEISLPVLFEKVAHEGISGEVTYCEGFDFVTGVIDELHRDRYFETDLHAARAVKASFLIINREYVNAGLFLFPPTLPDGNDRMKYFALPDAALRLGYVVSPKAGSMFPQPGVRGVVFTLSNVCPGWYLLGVLWGTDDEPTWVDRFAFSDLEIVEAPVLRT